MKQCHCSHKGMDIGISCVVIHFHVCKRFLQVLPPMSIACHQVVPFKNLSSSSSELSEHAGVLSEEWSVSELKDKWWCTGLVGVCGELQGVMVTVLQGVVCTGLKDACSRLETWCM